jgi:hypothetical protein
MATTFAATDPLRLTPEQRLNEVAAIFATGMRHLLSARAAASPSSMQVPVSARGESGRNCLEVSSESRLSVPRG